MTYEYRSLKYDLEVLKDRLEESCEAIKGYKKIIEDLQATIHFYQDKLRSLGIDWVELAIERSKK